MSSLGSILSAAQSALQVAQTQVATTSQNVANVNTPGYARKLVTQQETVAGGQGQGVSVVSIQNAANQFLFQANLTATAQAGAASVSSTTLDQAQSLFGDPSDSSSFFGSLDSVYSAFSTASDTPSSSLLRQEALTSVSTFLQNASNLSSNLSTIQAQSTQQIQGDVTTVNGLLKQISALNSTVTQASLSSGDATGPQNQQTQLLNQLAGLMNINVTSTATGGVTVRSSDGTFLAGDLGASTVAYSESGSAGILTATPPSGAAQAIKPGGGDIGGLIQLTKVELPQISAQLGQYVSQAVNQLNAASNASSAVPAPATLTGTATGMALSTAVSGFSGKTTIAVVNSAGVIQQQVAIDFSAGTMSVNGGTATSFTPSNFLGSLNTALGSLGSASFVNGALTLSAAGTGNGVVVADDSTTPTSNAGQGFSQFFGLNNLISSTSYTNFATGLSSSDPNTFSGNITLQVTDPNGGAVREMTVGMPTGGTIGDVVSALNTGVSGYGSFSLDTNGQLSFAPKGTSQNAVSVVSDGTANSAGGPSLAQMFGMGDAVRAALPVSYSLRSDIAADSSKMPTAQLDLSVSSGQVALVAADGSGALAMAQSGDKVINFAAGGGLAANSLSVSGYASEIAGLIGAKASAADAASQTATATAQQASSQLSSVTGVNLDEELVNLTTYQQAYSASARLIQAANAMYDTLLQMVP